MNEQSVIEVKASSSILEEERLILDTIDKFLEKDVKPFVREFESKDN